MIFQLEYRLRNAISNEYSCVIEETEPYYNKDGEFDGLICAFTDITERKEVKEGLWPNFRSWNGRDSKPFKVRRRSTEKELRKLRIIKRSSSFL